MPRASFTSAVNVSFNVAVPSIVPRVVPLGHAAERIGGREREARTRRLVPAGVPVHPRVPSNPPSNFRPNCSRYWPVSPTQRRDEVPRVRHVHRVAVRLADPVDEAHCNGMIAMLAMDSGNISSAALVIDALRMSLSSSACERLVLPSTAPGRRGGRGLCGSSRHGFGLAAGRAGLGRGHVQGGGQPLQERLFGCILRASAFATPTAIS